MRIIPSPLNEAGFGRLATRSRAAENPGRRATHARRVPTSGSLTTDDRSSKRPVCGCERQMAIQACLRIHRSASLMMRLMNVSKQCRKTRRTRQPFTSESIRSEAACVHCVLRLASRPESHPAGIADESCPRCERRPAFRRGLARPCSWVSREGGRSGSNRSVASGRCDQAIKGRRWMSWRREAMKDVGTCEKPEGAGNRAVISGCPNGETHP